jgi:hypothetical protein
MLDYVHDGKHVQPKGITKRLFTSMKRRNKIQECLYGIDITGKLILFN